MIRHQPKYLRVYLFYLVCAILIAGCTTMPENTDQVASYAIDDVHETLLAREIRAHKTTADEADGFILLDNGLDAFTARAVLAEVAEVSLDVQYYLYHADMVGHLFTYMLWQAAERGVRVRILVDDMDMAGRDKGILALDSHPNIELRLFNPFSRGFSRVLQMITGLGSVTRRMHNKSFIADNSAAILGGRNIGNEYFQADPLVDFADLDAMAVGDVVKDASAAFDLYWNSAQAYPATTAINDEITPDDVQSLADHLKSFAAEHQDSTYIHALKNSNLAHLIRSGELTYYWGEASVVVDDPDKIIESRDANELHLVSQLAPHFQGIKDELIVVSPYFVPGKEGVEFFRTLVEKGVKVSILTNSLASNDVGIVHAGYAKYRIPLLKAGVQLYEMNKKLTREERKTIKGMEGSSKASLHAKTFVLDRDKVFIGSLNLDPRSFYENTEIGLVIEQQEIAEHMANSFDQNVSKWAFKLELHIDEDGDEQLKWHGLENDKTVTYDVEPHTSAWRRIGVGLMGLLPVESQL